MKFKLVKILYVHIDTYRCWSLIRSLDGIFGQSRQSIP